MNVLLLSSGGGGGNILRSLKTLFAKDVATAQQGDPRFADRLRRAVTTRFLDTNEFSLADVPKEERLLIGERTTRHRGSGHDPAVAMQALEESRQDVERLIARYSVIVLIGTGGKGTGAGTMFALAQMARRCRKPVIPVFVRPSFERHEVDKRRFDHAVHVAGQFDSAGIRLIEILNDCGYSDSDPQPQTVVWEQMNLPIARGLRGLLYVMWDLSQVDPSDLSILLAGPGRMRIGFAEVDPPPDRELSEAAVEQAVRTCWHNAYCAFRKPTGTSLVCIQGDWSNLVDARIKRGLAALALDGVAQNPYNPLYARAFHTPKPWGITALFTEDTGVHQPLDLDWTLPKKGLGDGAERVERSQPVERVPIAVAPAAAPSVAPDRLPDAPRPHYESVWEFARAINRGDRAALALAAESHPAAMPVDGLEVRKLLGTFWFRSVFPRLSQSWRDRLFEALVGTLDITNHVVMLGRRAVPVRELTYDQLQQIVNRTLMQGTVGADLHLLVAIGALWGEQALGRVRFVDGVRPQESSRLSSLLGSFRA